MEKRVSLGERYRQELTTLGNIESDFIYLLDKEIDDAVKGGHNEFIKAHISRFESRVEERHGELYVQVVVGRDLTELPEEQKQYRCKEQFVFTKNIDFLNRDDLIDMAEDIARAIRQIMQIGTISYVTGERLKYENWMLEISQPTIYHGWKVIK